MISVNATLFVQIINLLVLLVIMNYVMYRPLRRLVEQRRQAISHGHAEARRQAEEAKTLEANYQDGLRRGRASIQERLAVFQDQATERCNAILEEAQDQARASSQQMRARVEKEMASARLDIRKEAELISQAMARHILQRRLS
jgi:F-type H+-transporting ATPase subunit b